MQDTKFFLLPVSNRDVQKPEGRDHLTNALKSIPGIKSMQSWIDHGLHIHLSPIQSQLRLMPRRLQAGYIANIKLGHPVTVF
jgi:hypothetical protein